MKDRITVTAVFAAIMVLVNIIFMVIGPHPDPHFYCAWFLAVIVAVELCGRRTPSHNGKDTQ